MIQYDGYTTIPQQVRDIVANKCKLLDEYILLQTGEREYTALIRDMVTDEVTCYTFTRAADYGVYSMLETVGTWEYTVRNEYYCYSNIGYGAALELPVMEGVQAHSAVVFTVVLMFLVVFRSTLFPFHKRK